MIIIYNVASYRVRVLLISLSHASGCCFQCLDFIGSMVYFLGSTVHFLGSMVHFLGSMVRCLSKGREYD